MGFLQVRRRLALQVDHYTAEPPALHVYKGPAKSNLGFRLQTATNLQVIFTISRRNIWFWVNEKMFILPRFSEKCVLDDVHKRGHHICFF